MIRSAFNRWARTSTPKCREIVLEILRSSPSPLKTQAIYQRALGEYAHEKAPVPPPLPEVPVDPPKGKKRKIKIKVPPPLPPHPDHPIRSVKYLKSVVLEDLAARNLIEKVHDTREPTPEELEQAKKRPGKKAKRNKSSGVAPVFINPRGLVDEWAWMLKSDDSQEVEKKEQQRIRKAIDGQEKLDSSRLEKEKEKEFLEEWGHLNVRRQRARKGKLEREAMWGRVLEQSRQEGVAEGEKATR